MTKAAPEPTHLPDTWTFGWQAIVVQVPSAWDMSAYDGTRASGSVALADDVRVRLRLRWSAVSRGGDPAEEAYRQYERQLRKTTGGSAVPERTDEARAGITAQPGSHLVPFEWSAATNVVYGVVLHDPDASRVVVAEACGPREMGRRGPRRVLSSIALQPDDADALWSAYGFAFRTPPLYNLESARLESGRLRYLFVRSSSNWFRVERWSLAAHLLRRAPLDQWPAEYLKLTRLRYRDLEAERPTAWGSHLSVQFRAALVLGGLGRLLRPSRTVLGRVWHDAAADRVTVVAGAGMDIDALDAIAATVEHRMT